MWLKHTSSKYKAPEFKPNYHKIRKKKEMENATAAVWQVLKILTQVLYDLTKDENNSATQWMTG
jgi:hypothetical protein